MQPTTITYHERAFSVISRLSFKQLIESWKEKMNEENLREFYGELLDKVSEFPELLEPIEDLSVLTRHKKTIAMMMATVFPITVSDQKDLYAISIPFTYTTIYYSSLFKALFIKDEKDLITIPNQEADIKLSQERLIMAYQMILNKFYGYSLKGNTTSVHPLVDPETGLKKYLELELDSRFVEVKLKDKLPEWSPSQCTRLTDILKLPSLQDSLPLNLFVFEGFVIIKLRDVTERETISNIKNQLLTLHSFADSAVFESLQEEMRDLIGLRDVCIGIAPFFKINNHYVFSEHLSQNSFLLSQAYTLEEKTMLYQQSIELFADQNNFLVIPTIDEEAMGRYPFLTKISEQGGKSMIICPLRSGKELIGVLSLVSDVPGMLRYPCLPKLESAVPLFVLALEKSAEDLDNRIDKVIKEQFTAVQSSVEWKFTEAALEYLTDKQKGKESKMKPIVFENVFPLYGAIDIRNSSIERSNAIQRDLLEQLNLAAAIIKKAQQQVTFPLLQEINYRIEKYIYNVSNILFSGDEAAIDNFLQEELVQMFHHLKKVIPAIQNEIAEYFTVIDQNIKIIYRHRQEFEQSITLINTELARFIDNEQKSAQEIFPHYFERFVTDGIDFNIYIGESITPNKTFDNFYLRNLKLWQLSTLAKAAQLTNQLDHQLSLSLNTTQLILAHSHPISISFRTAERKFDVDGAYNIRYEIIKKRIDKVRIKDSNERLTQPGKIAIVFSQPRESAEYTEYIDFLQNQGLLTGEIEKLDLEELQGVVGLKALRVAINLEEKLSAVSYQPSAISNRES